MYETLSIVMENHVKQSFGAVRSLPTLYSGTLQAGEAVQGTCLSLRSSGPISYTGDSSSIRTNYSEIKGNCNSISGNHNTITGNCNSVSGYGNVCKGEFNTFNDSSLSNFNYIQSSTPQHYLANNVFSSGNPKFVANNLVVQHPSNIQHPLSTHNHSPLVVVEEKAIPSPQLW